MYNAVACSQVSQTKRHGAHMNKTWKKYLDAIDPEKLTKKRKVRKKNPFANLFKNSDKVPLVEE